MFFHATKIIMQIIETIALMITYGILTITERRLSMLIPLFRILISIAIIFLFYTAYQYYHNPQRRLKKAKRLKKFYYVDDTNNSKKNIQFVYKGCLFEGEKYLGTTDDAFEVVDIHISVQEPLELKGFTIEDFLFLENEISKHYPHATLKWKHPINQIFPNKK